MRKFVFLALTAVIFSACTKEYTTEEHYDVNSYTHKYTVTAQDWKTYSDQTGNYYYCDIAEPKLTEKVFNDGVMVGYFYYALNGISIMTQLPFSDFFNIKDSQGNLTYKWEEQATVEFNPGHVVFVMKFDDHAPKMPSYSSYEFVVKFIW
ncbi:MAG: hypothetical protein LBN18_05230 [Dysgonamonadaceae bacterium]|jgi:hypothetical protein|nr:hypothetical protein [Dysgonamonadaceae bacterium]